MTLRHYRRSAAWKAGRWSRCQNSYSSVQQPSSCGKLSGTHSGIYFLIRSPTPPQSLPQHRQKEISERSRFCRSEHGFRRDGIQHAGLRGVTYFAEVAGSRDDSHFCASSSE